MNPDLAFIVIDATGHRFLIYANGKIEGFGAGCKIVNYIPTLTRLHSNMVRQDAGIEPLPYIQAKLEQASIEEPT